ncbi:MAG: hypothetical protein VR65_19340 [Desulfobulbaceae bacterium BRH_c16a]|nr:MAG: hypothetical protein VR65_19340 [Desulfobulbaceae bacterium BRH_c16a]
MMTICHVCGNEREAVSGSCPYCGNTQPETENKPEKPFVHKSVNLEAGRPVLDVALHRLTEVIDDAILNKVAVLTIIHGYGSSGKGGVIRSECRKTLDHMKNSRLIRDYIAGENYHKRSGQVKSLLQRFPRLGSDANLNRNNKGITLVIVS